MLSPVVPPNIMSRGFFCPLAGPEGCQATLQFFSFFHTKPGCAWSPPTPLRYDPSAFPMRLQKSECSPSLQATLRCLYPRRGLPVPTQQVPCPSLAQEPCWSWWEEALALKKLSEKPLLSIYLISSPSAQTQTGFFKYSFCILRIALSSHNLLPWGYKTDQITLLPTTATTVTKTKNLLACWFPLKPFCLSFTFPLKSFKIGIELLLLPQSTLPFGSEMTVSVVPL